MYEYCLFLLFDFISLLFVSFFKFVYISFFNYNGSYLRNKSDFWNVHGIMNTSGLQKIVAKI